MRPTISAMRKERASFQLMRNCITYLFLYWLDTARTWTQCLVSHIAMGPTFNLGLGGKIDENMEYYGVDEVSTEHYTVKFGKGVNDDYRNMQLGFQLSPGLYVNLNDKSKLTLNVTWEAGLNDAFNPRYKQANSFFDDYKGNQFNQSTVLTIGYEYHFSFADKY